LRSRVWRWTPRAGCVTGITITLVAGLSRLLANGIPGVRWRVEKIDAAREATLMNSHW